nr:MBL fold metallo-hydrolase [Candidatus Sigynarchaeota archaeon]
MKLTFLGTGAAEAYPAIFCNCNNCQRARILGGRNLRCRSSILVNDDLIIDYGPDTSAQCVRFNVDLTRVKNILITHSHPDHLQARDMIQRKLGARQKGTLEMLVLWGNQESLATFNEQVSTALMEEFSQGKVDLKPTKDEVLDELGEFLLMETRLLAPHQTISIGRYTVSTIHAHHKEPEESLNYIVDDGRTRFLYGTDTGLWAETEWKFIESLGKTMDVVALDCTVGLNPTGGHHNNDSFLKTLDEFIRRDLLSKDALFFAHHFSHQNNFVHDDLVDIMAPRGIGVTYDGLV